MMVMGLEEEVSNDSRLKNTRTNLLIVVIKKHNTERNQNLFQISSFNNMQAELLESPNM